MKSRAPRAHGLDRQFHRAPGRHDHHRQGGIERLDAVQQVEPFLAGGGIAGVVQVHQDDVEIARFHGVDHGRGRGGGFGAVAFAFDQEAEGFENVGLVVGNQDARACADRRISSNLYWYRNASR